MSQRYIPSRWNLGYDLFYYWQVNHQCSNTVIIRGIPHGSAEYHSAQVSLSELRNSELEPANAFAEWFRFSAELLVLTGRSVEIIINGEVWSYKGDLLDIGMPLVTGPNRVTSNSTRRAYVAGELIFGETSHIGEEISGNRMCHSMLSLVFDRKTRTIHGPFLPTKMVSYKNRMGEIGHVCQVSEGDVFEAADFDLFPNMQNGNMVPPLSQRYYVKIDGVIKSFRMSQRFGSDGGYADCLTAQAMYAILRSVAALEDERLGGCHREFLDYLLDEQVLLVEGDTYIFQCVPSDLQKHLDEEQLPKFKGSAVKAYDFGSNRTQHCILKMERERASSDLFGLSRAFHVFAEDFTHSPTGGSLCFSMTDKNGKFMDAYLYYYTKLDGGDGATVPGVCALLSDSFMLAYELACKGCAVDIAALQSYMFVAMFYSGWVGIDANNEVVPLLGFETKSDSVPLVCFDFPYAEDVDRRFTIQRTAIGTSNSAPVCHRKMTQQPEPKAGKVPRTHAYVVDKNGYVLYDPIAFLNDAPRLEREYGETDHPNVGQLYKVAFGVGTDSTLKGAECQVYVGKLSKNTFVSEGGNHFVGKIDSDAFSFENHGVKEV